MNTGKEHLVSDSVLVALGHSEIDDLGNQLPFHLRYQDIGRLDIAMDYTFLMGVLECLTNTYGQSHSFLDVQLMLVCIFKQWFSFHPLHDQVRATKVRRACVIDTGYIGMIHQGQHLTLSLEALEKILGVQAKLQNLQGHLTVNVLLLLGQPHGSPSTLSNPLH